jgi:hypothetical protein
MSALPFNRFCSSLYSPCGRRGQSQTRHCRSECGRAQKCCIHDHFSLLLHDVSSSIDSPARGTADRRLMVMQDDVRVEEGDDLKQREIPMCFAWHSGSNCKLFSPPHFKKAEARRKKIFRGREQLCFFSAPWPYRDFWSS